MKKIFLTLASFVFLVAPLYASAATLDELNTKLQSLLEQVAEVRQEITALQTAPRPQTTVSATARGTSSLCVRLHNSLYAGVSDATTNGEVSVLQKLLASDSSLYPEGQVSGYFGPATEAAVKRLQLREGVVTTGSPTTTGFGLVGSLTRTFLASHCDGVSTVTTPIPSDTRSTLTDSLQSALSAITFDVMPAFTSATPTITGTAKNLTQISVTVRSSEVVYTNNAVPVKDGHWSVTTSTLSNGSYQVLATGANGSATAVSFIVVNAPVASTPTPSGNTTPTPATPVPASHLMLKLNGSERGASVFAGSSVLLSWSATNVSSCALASTPSINVAGAVSANEFGKSSGPLQKTTVFTLTCIGADKTFVSASATATVSSR